jgi:hypothetical protein
MVNGLGSGGVLLLSSSQYNLNILKPGKLNWERLVSIDLSQERFYFEENKIIPRDAKLNSRFPKPWIMSCHVTNKEMNIVIMK